jgi:hypothetical protein
MSLGGPEVRVLERVSRVTPLGVRCWDPVTGQLVADGLMVAATPRAGGRRRVATRTPSGTFALRGLPGLHEQEQGEGDAGYWASVATRPFLVEVADLQRRFHPVRVEAEAPTRGVLGVSGLPEGVRPPLPAVPLLSTASRPVPPGMAVVRAELAWTDRRPAALALLEVTVAGRAAVLGLADRLGRVAVMFPYPDPPAVTGSPPSGGGLATQAWTVGLAAYASPGDPGPDPPDLHDLLGQPRVTPLATLSPPSPLTEAVLAFGRELVVASTQQPVLFLTSDDSPP